MGSAGSNQEANYQEGLFHNLIIAENMEIASGKA
jgi:hypothetical protein